MPRPRNETYICYGYGPGTALATRPATTPECEPHEPWPEGYVASSEYAELMAETHGQRECRGCGLWLIWSPKPGVPATTATGD